MAGPYQPLPEILPPAPAAGSLLQSVGTIAGEWRSGVSMAARAWTNYEWPDCADDWEISWTAKVGNTVLADKPIKGDAPACTVWYFDPFTVYTPLSGIEVPPDMARRLAADAQRAHDSMFSSAVARALWNPKERGTTPYLPPFRQEATLNPTLGYGAKVSTTVLDPAASMAALFSAYATAAGTTAGATFHVSPVVLPYLLQSTLVNHTGQRYLGPAGSIVVADAGYPSGEIPRDVVNDTFATPVPLAPESWMFVTGPVEVAYDTARTVDGGQVADARWNQWALLIEQRAIFRFDPRLAFGAQVCVPAFSCSEFSSS